MTYNKSDSPIYKSAHRIRAAAGPILQELEQFSRQSANGDLKQVEAVHVDTNQPNANIGDLEPPFSILELLLSEEAIQSDTALILGKDPLTSLLSNEFATWKPPPLPSPPKVKPVRDRKAEKERRLERLRAMEQNAPTFRVADLAPRTRSARAAAAAFEAEANATPDSASTPEMEMEGDGSVPARKRSRRPPLVLPGQADIPPVVDDVDNQRSFEMFDEGWILPSSQRRGGRAPIERHELPPSKKKVRPGMLNYP